jgi:hypothetical protein
VIINGTLLARGTSGSSVIFTADQSGDANRWNGIRFGDAAVDATFDTPGNYISGSIIEYTDISGIANHPNGSIRAESSNPFIHGSTIHDNLSSGIVGISANGLRIIGNRFENNTSSIADGFWGGGVRLHGSNSVIVADNKIAGNLANGGGGVYLFQTNNSSISHNIIEDNYGFSSVTIQRSNDIAIMENTIAGQEPRPSGLGGVGVSIDRANRVSFGENLIMGNDAFGLEIQETTGVSLLGDRITNNGDGGIHFIQNVAQAVISSNPSNPTIVTSNGDYEIYNEQIYELTTDPLARGNVDARHVWWGTTDIAAIQARIFDFFDDSFKGIVFTDPVTPSMPSDGDFNGDRAVDAADYVVWRKRGGVAAEYQVWRSRFGTSPTIAASVPEPMSLLLCLVAVASTVLRLRCIRRARNQSQIASADRVYLTPMTFAAGVSGQNYCQNGSHPAICGVMRISDGPEQ